MLILRATHLHEDHGVRYPGITDPRTLLTLDVDSSGLLSFRGTLRNLNTTEVVFTSAEVGDLISDGVLINALRHHPDPRLKVASKALLGLVSSGLVLQGFKWTKLRKLVMERVTHRISVRTYQGEKAMAGILFIVFEDLPTLAVLMHVLKITGWTFEAELSLAMSLVCMLLKLANLTWIGMGLTGDEEIQRQQRETATRMSAIPRTSIATSAPLPGIQIEVEEVEGGEQITSLKQQKSHDTVFAE